MSTHIEAKLLELGIELPQAAAPAANYVPFVQTGKLVFISGQLPIRDSVVQFKGRIGHELTIEQGQEAARLCGLNILAQLKVACGGDLNRVVRCIRLGGFVNSAADFVDQPKVINGASDVMVLVLGEHGRHTRAAVSSPALPLNAAVEIDAVFEIM